MQNENENVILTMSEYLELVYGRGRYEAQMDYICYLQGLLRDVVKAGGTDETN